MKNRRDFLKKASLAGLGAVLLSPQPTLTASANPKHISENKDNNAPSPMPTEAQKKWMELGFGMFIHFGINTYYDKEWSDGTLAPNLYNPKSLDTDQWCRVAKAAGMKYIVLVTKHHDGFCNWPTQYTDYSVKSTPYQGDIIALLSKSAQKHGLALGLYYSLWDRHEKSHDTNEGEYVQFMKNQLQELLTNYGPICELWFDGFWKKQQSGWTSKKTIEGEVIEKSSDENRDQNFINAWRNEGTYRWQMDHLYQFIKQLQPNCLVMNNSTTAYTGVPLHPVDIRSGEKATTVKEDKKVWNWLGKDQYMPLQIETTLSVKGDEKFPSGNWFWHAWDHSVATKEQIQDWLQVAKKMEANLLLNCPISPEGLLRPEDEKVLLSLQTDTQTPKSDPKNKKSSKKKS